MQKLAAVALLSLLAGCSDTPTAVDSELAGRYWRVDLYGSPFPVEGPRHELIEDGRPTGVYCTDRIEYVYLELAQDSAAAQVVKQERDCTDASKSYDRETRTAGTYSVEGDTVRLRFRSDDRLVGTWGITARIEPGALVVEDRVYTVDEPEGRVVLQVYRRRQRASSLRRRPERTVGLAS